MSTSFVCPLCNFNAPTRNLWLSHIRSVHHEDDNFFVTCGIDECTSTYTRCASFVSHVYRQHRNVVVSSKNSENALEISNTDVSEEVDYNTMYEGEERTDLQHAIDQITQNDNEQQQKKSALFILNLKEIRCLSESAVDHVVKETQKVFKHTIGRLRAGVNECIVNSGIDPSSIPNLTQFLSNAEQPFQGLNSSFLQEKFYREHFGCIVSYLLSTYLLLMHIDDQYRSLSLLNLVQLTMACNYLETNGRKF